MGLADLYDDLTAAELLLLEKQATAARDEDASGRFMARGFVDELRKLAAFDARVTVLEKKADDTGLVIHKVPAPIPYTIPKQVIPSGSSPKDTGPARPPLPQGPPSAPAPAPAAAPAGGKKGRGGSSGGSKDGPGGWGKAKWEFGMGGRRGGEMPETFIERQFGVKPHEYAKNQPDIGRGSTADDVEAASRAPNSPIVGHPELATHPPRRASFGTRTLGPLPAELMATPYASLPRSQNSVPNEQLPGAVQRFMGGGARQPIEVPSTVKRVNMNTGGITRASNEPHPDEMLSVPDPPIPPPPSPIIPLVQPTGVGS